MGALFFSISVPSVASHDKPPMAVRAFAKHLVLRQALNSIPRVEIYICKMVIPKNM